MESGEGNWEHTGLWHLQANPDDIAISGDINPALVSLPDYGYLPSAYLGDYVWWYGNADDGTFLGDWTLANQVEKNGGWSDAINYGDLISEDIDLTTSDAANLTFWSWWEIEGVDVDRYDLMDVYVTTDAGLTWDKVVGMNPINDVDGEAFKSYSSGGLGEIGQWIHTQADLLPYVGSTIKLKFSFETVDEKYNGFRGWLIDDVRITNDATVKPSFDSQTAQASESCGGDSGGAIATPAKMYLYRSQQVSVESSGDWYITPFGSDDYVAAGVAGINSGVFLNAGYYALWVKLPAGQTCPDALLVTGTASFYGGPGQAIAQPGGLVWLYGDNFLANSTVDFIPGSSSTAVQAVTPADNVAVVSSTEIQVEVPTTLSNGTYGIRVTSPSGKKTTLANVLTITTDTAPAIDYVSPEEVDDATNTTVTITGSGFVAGVVAAIGGVPLTELTVSDTEIVGTLPVGSAGGYQNVDVINPDGQEAELIGAVNITDTATTSYTPSIDATTAPAKVKHVVITKETRKGAHIRWQAVAGADHYVIQVKRGNKVKKLVTSNKHKVTITGLNAATIYKVQVRAMGTYLGGKYSKTVQFGTLN
ncbi:MAG: Chitinase [uncultured bacterium]|nr:MAG: Chitinase [uncultured bacterium]